MSVKVLKDEKLEKHFRVVVPAKDLEKAIEAQMHEIAPTIKMQGFRPGKVPVSFVKKKYGASIRQEAIQKEVNNAISSLIKDKKLKTVGSPSIEDIVAAEGKDLEFTVKANLLPEIKNPDFKKVKLTKPVVKPTDKEIDENLKKLAEMNLSYDKESKSKAEKGDQVTIDFVGYVGGKAFDGGAMKGHKLVLGSGSFIPGFEDQLIGAKSGDKVAVKVTFPESYHAKDLAGKEAEFKVEVNAVHKPETPKIDDEFAKNFGLKDLKELKERSSQMLTSSFDAEILAQMKLNLFDHLEKEFDFDVPESMFEQEYKMIKAQAEEAEKVEEDNSSESKKGSKKDSKGAKSAEKNLESKKDSKKDDESYRRIALRRVRIGLFLVHYAEENNIQLTQDDLKNAILTQARMFPGQEQLIIDYYTKNPRMLEALKGPIIEDKSVKQIFAKEITSTEKEYSVKEMEDFIKAENEREVL